MCVCCRLKVKAQYAQTNALVYHSKLHFFLLFIPIPSFSFSFPDPPSSSQQKKENRNVRLVKISSDTCSCPNCSGKLAPLLLDSEWRDRVRRGLLNIVTASTTSRATGIHVRSSVSALSHLSLFYLISLLFSFVEIIFVSLFFFEGFWIMAQ